MRRITVALLAAVVMLSAFGAYMLADHGAGAESSGPGWKTGSGQLTLSAALRSPRDEPQPKLPLPKTEGFEGTWPGNWALYGNPTWGPETCNKHSGAKSGWAARGGTNGLPGCVNNYPNNMNSWMVYGPFDLSGKSAAGVNFWFDLDSELNYDYFWAAASGDDVDYYGSWFTGDFGGWRNDYPFDLSDWLGDSSVWFAFIFDSDSIITDLGAFVDDIEIWSTAETPIATPTPIPTATVSPTPTPGVDYWAVIAGVADYPGTANDLNYTDDDAYDVRDALLASTNWQASHITMLIDSAATKANIQNAINWMGTNGDANDAFFFFFSGHGTTVSDQAPLDETDGYDEALYQYDAGTVGSIRDDELGNWLAALPGSPELVAIDTCFSGGMIKTDEGQSRGLSGVGVPARGDGFPKDLDDVVDGVVLTAADDDEYSYEFDALQNGLFSYYFVEGLYGPADIEGDGDGTASMEEDFTYLYPRVLDYFFPSPPEQHPQQYDNWPGEAPLTIMIPLTPTPTPTPNCDPGVDTDSDGFDNDIECYLATDPLDDCPDDPSDDAWPLDIDMSGDLSVTGDVYNYRDRIGAVPGAPNWWQRLDFDMSEDLSVTGDVFMYRDRIGDTCG